VWDRDVRGCSRRIGIRPPPLRTEHGWLIIYHGVKDTVSGALYRVAIALADLVEPTRVTHRLPGWIFGPDAHYERTGDVPNAVFPCGLVDDEQTGELRLYYGAADTTVALASAQFDEVLAARAGRARVTGHTNDLAVESKRYARPFMPTLAPIPDRLRVAMLAPISWRVPPRRYGPWEQFVSLLTEGLVRRGVDVTLFATADSETGARLVGTAPTGYSEDERLDAKVWESLHISAVFEQAEEFDLIHNSFDFLPLTYSGLVTTPVLTTIHGFSSERILPVFEKYNRRGYYVAISDTDRNQKLEYLATIHHGIEMQKFSLGAGSEGYLLFFGRIHPDKGTAEAIEVAKRAAMPLVIAGIIQDHEYFERFVEPSLDGRQISYIGAVGPERRSDLLGGAEALLHLINFDEPFGFSVVEAMACGTPVITQARGSMSEIVREGENGFLVNSVDEAVAAVHAAAGLDRTAVRATVEHRFDADRMVDDYLACYHRVVELDRERRRHAKADAR
jgi:glycosyltransferase involved in cell wall biosynthesis